MTGVGLIRFSFLVLDWLSQKQRALKRVNQILGGRNVAFQVSNNAGNCLNGFVGGNRNIARNGQGYTDYPIQVGQARGLLEVNDRQRNGGQGYNFVPMLDTSELGCGLIDHDGSYKLFRWDSTKGCMVPFTPSIPVTQRFKRSVAAFIRTWTAP